MLDGPHRVMPQVTAVDELFGTHRFSVPTASGFSPVRPKHPAICERMIGTLRHELLDRILIVNERHLRRILAIYLQHVNTARPHRTLGQLAPAQAETHPHQ
jgi:Integrase core domain